MSIGYLHQVKLVGYIIAAMSQQQYALSAEVHHIFDTNFIEKHPKVCSYCTGLENMQQACDGSVLKVFCPGCQISLSQNHYDLCKGFSPNCLGKRYVSPVGIVAPLCRNCHQFNLCKGRGENCLTYCQVTAKGKVQRFCKNCRQEKRRLEKRRRWKTSPKKHLRAQKTQYAYRKRCY